jgi:hypothetical protein
MPKSTKSPSWRDILPVHPAAEIFPLMSPDELRALGEDIKKHGLREPVVLFAEEGGGGIYRETEQLLLDGRPARCDGGRGTDDDQGRPSVSDGLAR